MVDITRSHAGPAETRFTATPAPGELREVAYDLLGRPERDELSPDEEARLAAEVEQVVSIVLHERREVGPAASARPGERLAQLLRTRVERLPLHLRVTLANARRRQYLGID